jgi:hypothetical protein
LDPPPELFDENVSRPLKPPTPYFWTVMANPDPARFPHEPTLRPERLVDMVRRMWPACWLLASPSLFALLAIAGPFTTDPVRLFAGLGVNGRPAWLPGYGTIDPNMGFTAYALGRRAAEDWLSGTLPLWNPFEGLGQPLLGEMQSAALFPPTLLLLLPHGQVWEQALLQAIAGFGTYVLLRRLGVSRAAALVGGILFELNGVFAWLRNAIYNPVALLPWLLYVVETLAQARLPWRERLGTISLGALVAALALYAGFPETVYFYGLLVALWAAFRFATLHGRRLAFLTDLIAFGAWGLLIAAPVLLAFVHFLPEAEVGGHKNDLFQGATLPQQALLLTFLPYAYGPIFAAPLDKVRAVFGGFGGYWGLMPALLAVGGLYAGRRHALTWLMAGWIVFALAVSHGVPGVHDVFMHVPLAAIAAYSRYFNAGWLLCGVLLAARFLDRLPALPNPDRRRAGLISLAVVAIALAVAVTLAWPTLGELWWARLGLRTCLIASGIVAAALLLGFALALRSRHCVGLLAGLAIAEALVAFLLPLVSNPRIRDFDRPVISFLQTHAGLQRVATVAGAALMPNFGSAFRIANINYNDLPVPARTVAFVHAHLDPHADAVMFQPTVGPAHSRAEIEARLPGYLAASVRYLLAPANFFPSGDSAGPVEAFRGVTASVYELAGAAPYAEAPGCRVTGERRDRLHAECDAPSLLVRRELFMRGWTAQVNGTPAAVSLVEEAFQGVELPAGASTVSFTYAPAGVRPSCAVALMALLAALIAAPPTMYSRRSQADKLQHIRQSSE